MAQWEAMCNLIMLTQVLPETGVSGTTTRFLKPAIPPLTPQQTLLPAFLLLPSLHMPLTCGQASSRAGIAQHGSRAELRWGRCRKALGQEGPRQGLCGRGLQDGQWHWLFLDTRPRGEGGHRWVHLQWGGGGLGRGQGWRYRLRTPQKAFEWGAHRGRRWGQAAWGAGIRTGRVCARCSAPSIGWVKQAWEVTVLVVDELKHVWGKKRLCEWQQDRGRSQPLHMASHTYTPPVHTAVCAQAMPQQQKATHISLCSQTRSLSWAPVPSGAMPGAAPVSHRPCNWTRSVLCWAKAPGGPLSCPTPRQRQNGGSGPRLLT